MPNALVANTDGALSGAGPMAAQGPEVDTEALKTQSPPQPKQMSADEVQKYLRRQIIIDKKLFDLVQTKGPITRRLVTNMAVSIVAERLMSAQEMAGYLADLPEDPEQVREWVERHSKEVEAELQQILDLVHESVPSDEPMAAFGEGISEDQHVAGMNAPENPEPVPERQVQ